MSNISIPLKIDRINLENFSFNFNNFNNILWINNSRGYYFDKAFNILKEENSPYYQIIIITSNDFDYREETESIEEPPKYSFKVVNEDGNTTDEETIKKLKPVKLIKFNDKDDKETDKNSRYEKFERIINTELSEDVDRKIFFINYSNILEYYRDDYFINFTKKLLDEKHKVVFFMESTELLFMITSGLFYEFDNIVTDLSFENSTIFNNIIRKNFDMYFTEENTKLKNKEIFEDIVDYIYQNDYLAIFSKKNKNLFYARKNFSESNLKEKIKIRNFFSDNSSNSSETKSSCKSKESFGDNDIFMKKNSDTILKEVHQNKSNENNNNENQNITINLNINNVKDKNIVININI
jgi:hypothetical protein